MPMASAAVTVLAVWPHGIMHAVHVRHMKGQLVQTCRMHWLWEKCLIHASSCSPPVLLLPAGTPPAAAAACLEEILGVLVLVAAQG